MSPDPTIGMQPEQPAADVTVCITKKADGTYLVGLERPEAEEAMATSQPGAAQAMPGMPPAAGGSGEPGEQDGMQPAEDIEQAMTMARQLLEAGASEEMTVEQAFQGGFNDEPAQPGY